MIHNTEHEGFLFVISLYLFQGVQHLGPATDFYKKLALDCSGQQIGVDLFLLSSQYADLASLCKNTQHFNLVVKEKSISIVTEGLRVLGMTVSVSWFICLTEISKLWDGFLGQKFLVSLFLAGYANNK